MEDRHAWAYERMSWEDRKELLQHAFAGKDAEGKRFGVYAKKDGEKLVYTIRGALFTESGTLPMTKEEAQEKLKVDTEYCNVNPLDGMVGVDKRGQGRKKKKTKFASP